MPIRPPAGAEIRELIAALASDEPVARESAIARLAVIGARTIDPLLRAFPSADPRLQNGILRAFEATAEPRALGPARAALKGDQAAIFAAAAAVLRALLTAPRSDAASGALDVLVAVAVDTTRPSAARVAALDALRDAPRDIVDPLRQQLAADRDPEVRAHAASPPGTRDRDDRDVWSAAAAGRLPLSPEMLKRALAAHRTTARLTELQRLIDLIRYREQQEQDAARREQWRVVRGAVHQALAARNSRLALYDLRDSLLDPERLPVAFLAAVEEIGDASCLEVLAAAYDASSRSGDTWWREHVAAAFRAIVQRDGLTRRHTAVKRVMARWPESAADLMART